MGNKNDFFGIVIYSIEEDGCLNGLWTNIANNNEIHNEIAKKKGNVKKTFNETTDLKGSYSVTFFDNGNNLNSGTLEIDLVNNKNEFYFKLDWKIKNGSNFTGKGFKIGKQLIVSYWIL